MGTILIEVIYDPSQKESKRAFTSPINIWTRWKLLFQILVQTNNNVTCQINLTEMG